MRSGRLLLMVALSLACVDRAHALRCKGATVNHGDRKVEVIAKCGEPTWKETRSEATIERVFHEVDADYRMDEHRSTRTVEEWVYNFGPSRLLQFLRFVNGVLTDITTGEYGYMEQSPGIPGAQCLNESTAKGRRAFEVVKYCGEPASIDVYEVERGHSLLDREDERVIQRYVTVTAEDWVYNFGPHRLLYVFTFENGRVVKVETRGYGF